MPQQETKGLQPSVLRKVAWVILFLALLSACVVILSGTRYMIADTTLGPLYYYEVQPIAWIMAIPIISAGALICILSLRAATSRTKRNQDK
jgi:TRAP-type C4-dicarboxylate transport system permease small subunit